MVSSPCHNRACPVKIAFWVSCSKRACWAITWVAGCRSTGRRPGPIGHSNEAWSEPRRTPEPFQLFAALRIDWRSFPAWRHEILVPRQRHVSVAPSYSARAAVAVESLLRPLGRSWRFVAILHDPPASPTVWTAPLARACRSLRVTRLGRSRRCAARCCTGCGVFCADAAGAGDKIYTERISGAGVDISIRRDHAHCVFVVPLRCCSSLPARNSAFRVWAARLVACDG